MKKILAGALIGAFVFGVSVADFNLASATSIPIDKNSTDKNTANKNIGDKNRLPEPPKDSDGNPLPPPDQRDAGPNKNNSSDKNSNDNNRPPEPPKDSDGNPLPPPDKNSTDK